MNRFVIANGLPYLFANGKTFAVRWDAEGFTVGAEVELASAPSLPMSELSVRAKCTVLDSIGEPEQQPEPEAAKSEPEQQPEPEEKKPARKKKAPAKA